MARNLKEEEILDWTVSDYGFEEPEPAPVDSAPVPEAPAAPKFRLPPLRLPRRWPLFLAVPAVLVLLAVWAGQQWQNARLRQEIETTLQQYQQPPFAPFSLLRYRPTTVSLTNSAPPQLLELETVGLNRVRARVAYTFFAPDGKDYEFSLPRVFERTETGWAAVVEAEDATQYKIESYRSIHFSIIYLEPDAEIVNGTLAPFLEDVINRACSIEFCANGVALTMFQPDSLVGYDSGPPIETSPSQIFQLISTEDVGASPQFNAIKSPYFTGLPLNATSLDYWKHIIALKALLQLEYNNAPLSEPAQLSHNPFFYALIARKAAQLELDNESALTYNDVPLAEQLTFLNQDFSTQSFRRLDDQSLLTALALLNRYWQEFPQVKPGLLQRQVLLVGFGPGPGIWLMQGALTTKPTLADFVKRWYRFLGQEALPPTLPSSEAELLISCTDGPQFLAQGQTYSLFPPLQPPIISFATAGWSPTGRYLALGLGYTPSVLDLETGQVVMPAQRIFPEVIGIPLAWADETVLAYLSIGPDIFQNNGTPNFQLRFMDAADPAREFPASRDALTLFFAFSPSYLPSPDKARAFALRPGTFADGLSQLDVLFPAIGGAATRVANNVFQPVWSADSRALAYVTWDEQASTLDAYAYDVIKGTYQLVWSGQSWMPELENFGNTRAAITWSPNRRWIALAVSATTEWLGLVAPDGSGAERLEQAVSGIEALAFSPNSRYLAVVGTRPEQQLVIYDVITKQAVQKFIGTWRGPLEWSPDGSQLLLFNAETAYLLNNPGGEVSKLTPLTRNNNCGLGMWKTK